MDTKTETKTLQHFIGGTWVDAEDSGVFDVLNPLDDSLYAHAAKGTSADMRAAVAASKAAFPAYRDTSVGVRGAKRFQEQQEQMAAEAQAEIDERKKRGTLIESIERRIHLPG